MERSENMISAISRSSSSFPLVTILLVIPILLVLYSYNQRNWRNAPPGPVGWPILGFLPRISSRLHHDFFELAKQYGPLMSVKMGVKPAIVVSSPEMAYEVLKVQDAVVSSRTITEAIQIAAYDASSVAFSPYGPSWLVLRKIIMSELLSPTSLKSFEPLRKQQVHGLLRELYKVSLSKGSIDIADSAFWALANQISTLVVSECLFDSTEKGGQVKDKFVKVMATFGTPNMSDLIPVLKPFDPQGIRRKLVQLFSGLDAFYDELVDKRLEAKQVASTTSKNGKRDLLDVLLEYRSEKKEYGYETLPRKVIKGMLSDMFMAGTVTSSSTIEWGMVEILRHPQVYRKVVEELVQVVGKDRFVEEGDIANLHYFQAVIKEVFRMHPAVPLLVPRRTNEACQIQGYDVPKHCIVYVNVWGMGRDPKVWDNPLEFKPERFVGSSVDVLGQNYNLLPFGAGRRYCAGMLLGQRMVHLYVASLLHAFEWDFPKEALNDSSEIGVIALKKAISLVGTAKPRFADSLYHK